MHYKIARNGQVFGPYTLDDLHRYLASGNVLTTDLAKSEEMADWLPVSQVLGITASSSAVPPPAAVSQSYQSYPNTTLNPAGLSAAYPPPPNLNWVVLLVIGFFCGIFTLVWVFVQAAWMRKVDPASKALSYYIAAVVTLFLAVASSSSTHLVALAVLLFLAYVALFVVGNLSLRSSIERHFNEAEPIGLRLSVPMTIFFSVFYFQYHFNRINEARQHGGLRGI